MGLYLRNIFSQLQMFVSAQLLSWLIFQDAVMWGNNEIYSGVKIRQKKNVKIISNSITTEKE